MENKIIKIQEKLSRLNKIRNIYNNAMIELHVRKSYPRNKCDYVMERCMDIINGSWVKSNSDYICKPINMKLHEYLNNTSHINYSRTGNTYKFIMHKSDYEIYVY